VSNFSSVYQVYLTGYAGVDEGAGMPTTERLCQALALGVYHRTTSKPPLMSSVAVTAELRAMSDKVPPVVTPKIVGDLKIVGGVTPATKLPIIKAIREITYLGLKEAKDVADEVQFGIQKTILTAQPDRVEAAAKLLREAGCVVEVS